MHSEKTRNEVLERLKKGQSLRTIQDELNVSKPTIMRWKREDHLGIKTNFKKWHTAKEQIECVKKFYKGETARKLAKEYKVSDNTIRDWIRKYKNIDDISASEVIEIERFRAEIENLKKENERLRIIMKTTSLFLTSESEIYSTSVKC